MSTDSLPTVPGTVHLRSTADPRIEGLERRWRLGEPLRQSEIADLFGLSRRVVMRRLAGVEPDGRVLSVEYYAPETVRQHVFGRGDGEVA